MVSVIVLVLGVPEGGVVEDKVHPLIVVEPTEYHSTEPVIPSSIIEVFLLFTTLVM